MLQLLVYPGESFNIVSLYSLYKVSVAVVGLCLNLYVLTLLQLLQMPEVIFQLKVVKPVLLRQEDEDKGREDVVHSLGIFVGRVAH